MDGAFLLFLAVSILCGIAVTVLIVGVSGLVLVWRRRARLETLEQLGLTPSPDGSFHGTVGGMEVLYLPRELGGHHAGGFGIRVPTGTLSLSSPPLPGRDVRLGDDPFDELFQVHGTPADLARLTAQVRAQMMAVPSSTRIGISDHWLWIDSPSFRSSDLGYACRIARALTEADCEPEERLLRLATEDPLPSVRFRALALAAHHHPSLAARIARHTQHDADAQIRAESAIILREPGALVRAALDVEVALELRSQAANTLGEVGSRSDRLKLGQRLMLERGSPLALHGVALLRSAGEDAEPTLIELLPLEQGEVLESVIRALGEVGTIRAVPALRARQAGLSMLQSRLHRLAEQSIRQIQAKAGGQRGGLAIAQVQGGLSVAGRQGGLAVAEGSAPGERYSR